MTLFASRTVALSVYLMNRTTGSGARNSRRLSDNISIALQDNKEYPRHDVHDCKKMLHLLIMLLDVSLF
jgi:hypothetical protein